MICVGSILENFQPKARGRPKDLVRRARIIDSAMKLFLEHGMQAVSIEAIAEHAGVSNRTVYSHFTGKQDLLWALIVRAGEAKRPIIQAKEATSTSALRTQLIDFGVSLVTLLTEPTIIKLGNLMLSEAGRHPDLAKQFYEWGPQRGQIELAELLESARQHKLIASDASPNLAQHLIAMLQGRWHSQQQLGLTKPLTRPQIKKHVTDCVDLFLKAVRK